MHRLGTDRGSSDGWSANAQFKASGYSAAWVISVNGPSAATETVWKKAYSFNSVALTGTKTLTKSPSCAGHGGVGEPEMQSVPFTMTKTG